MPSFSRCISICALAVASCGEPASSPVRLARCCSRTGVITICAMRTASSLRLNCALLASKNALMSASLGVAFSPTSFSTTFCASRLRRRSSRMSAAVRLRFFSSSSNAAGGMFFFASLKALSSSALRQLDLELVRLGEQDVLDDQLVQQVQLRGVGLFLRRLLLILRRRAPIRLLDVVARDLVAVHDRPRIGGRRGRGSRAAGGPARGGEGGQGEDNRESGHLSIVTAARRMMSCSCVTPSVSAAGTGLQDVGRLHFVDVAVPDGRHILPSGPAPRSVPCAPAFRTTIR